MPKRRSSADITAEMEVIRSQINELVDAEGTDEEVEQNVTRSQELLAEIEELDKERSAAVEYEKRVEAVRALALQPAHREDGDGARPPAGRGPEVMVKVDPFDTDPRELSRRDIISRAMTAIDGEKYVPITDSNKGHLDHLIHRSQDEEDPESQFDGGYVARRVLFTENPAYRSAFKKYCRLGVMAQFNAAEQRAISALQDFELRRAASEGTTTAGGFGVPVKVAA